MQANKIIISFLITHFNRPKALQACIGAIRNVNLPSYEIVVSDDSSTMENIKTIKKLNIEKLVLSDANIGLAGNINKGIRVCEGEFIFYCQEDFMLKLEFKNILSECLNVLNTCKSDMIRFTSIVKFKRLKSLTENIVLIPKFSFQNILLNYYQYSDHPYLVKNTFYDKFGYFLENTSGDYGETEYAVRIFKSKAKIAITIRNYVQSVEGSQSVIDRDVRIPAINIRKSWRKVARSFRLHFEWVFYNKKKRGLITYKNRRKLVN